MLFPQIYKTIDVQVALVGMEIWSDGDKIKVDSNIGVTFNNFLNWHRSNLGKKKIHDHAQLLRWAPTGQAQVYIGGGESYSKGFLAGISVQFYLLDQFSESLSSTISNSSVRLLESHVRSLKWPLGRGITICGHYNAME